MLEIKKHGLRVCSDRLPLARVKLRPLSFVENNSEASRSLPAYRVEYEQASVGRYPGERRKITISHLAFVNRSIKDDCSINRKTSRSTVFYVSVSLLNSLRKKIIDDSIIVLRLSLPIADWNNVIPGRNDFSITTTNDCSIGKTAMINETHLEID